MLPSLFWLLAASSSITGDEVLALEKAMLGKSPAIYQRYYKANTRIAPAGNNLTIYTWAEVRSLGGSVSSDRDGHYSGTTNSARAILCKVSATVRDGAIIVVTAQGDPRTCRHMFAVMKRLK